MNESRTGRTIDFLFTLPQSCRCNGSYWSSWPGRRSCQSSLSRCYMRKRKRENSWRDVLHVHVLYTVFHLKGLLAIAWRRIKWKSIRDHIICFVKLLRSKMPCKKEDKFKKGSEKIIHEHRVSIPFQPALPSSRPSFFLTPFSSAQVFDFFFSVSPRREFGKKLREIRLEMRRFRRISS